MTPFVPLAKMMERVDIDREDSDIAAFFALLYYGEMLTKLVVLGLVAAVRDDPDRTRYRLLHRLVRADGIGEWALVLDDILTGDANQFVRPTAREELKQLTQKMPSDAWQYEAVEFLGLAAMKVGISRGPLPGRLAARLWFAHFAEFRNKTRGHGASLGQQCSEACVPLEESMKLIAKNLRLFQRPWAYLHRNLSGKYRVTALGGNIAEFEHLRKEADASLEDGVYIAFDADILRVDLVESDVDASDFLLANGHFKNRRYELLSYLSNQRSEAPGNRFMKPVAPLPFSETHPRGNLDVVGKCFCNLPPRQTSYVRREDLEDKLREQLLMERHPIVTLRGRGGIGKTTLALRVLYGLAEADEIRYSVIVWFSARDIDLLSSGPKPVRPHVVTLEDFAREYVNLLNPAQRQTKGFRSIDFFASELEKASVGPTLFVFDNYETVDDAFEVYEWIDTFVRPPNKVLITTRMRRFRADYPIEVEGMSEDQARELIHSTAGALGTRFMITDEYVLKLYRESDGHPYVMKILLGEAARARRRLEPRRILASQDDILGALFDRNYAAIAPAAQRVFLLLCNWRSVVPELALEAVVLRSAEKRFDVRKALDELQQTSFIERLGSEEDSELFISVPFSAMAFGKQKLAVSPLKAQVEVDTEFLRAFGAAGKEDVRHGVLPRVKRLFKTVAQRVEDGDESLEDTRPALEFIARRLPETWIQIAELYAEQGTSESMQEAKVCLRKYLESPSVKQEVSRIWYRLAELCRQTDDPVGEVHALVEMCQVPGVPLWVVSNGASQINGIYSKLKRGEQDVLDSDERKTLVRKVVAVMEQQIAALDATDCSRLAWLYLHLRNPKRALELARQGSWIDPSNEHCYRLLAKLSD